MDAIASKPQGNTMQPAVLGKKKLCYFDMRCEHSKVVCDGKVMALLKK
jgi:hypothetical protein